MRPSFTVNPPAPLSDDERASRVRQYLEARQQERLCGDTRYCSLRLLYSPKERWQEVERWEMRKHAYASVLELDDRVTGKDFLTDAMVEVLPQDAITREQIVDMLVWHHFGAAEREPRLEEIVTRHLAAIAPALDAEVMRHGRAA